MTYTTHNKYIRDDRTGALVNTDNEALEVFRSEREKTLRLMEMEAQVNSLKNDMSDIKQLLIKLVNGNNNG